jgi:ArsR family transcriptional regulator, arsenate/arsenite/antimonite-responsive transcriptional repressor
VSSTSYDWLNSPIFLLVNLAQKDDTIILYTYEGGELMEKHTYGELAKIFFALSDPKRLEIIHLLGKQEMNCSELSQILNVSLPTVTYHLKILINAGIVEERKSGSWKYGVLRTEVLENAFEMIKCHVTLPQ